MSTQFDFFARNSGMMILNDFNQNRMNWSHKSVYFSDWNNILVTEYLFMWLKCNYCDKKFPFLTGYFILWYKYYFWDRKKILVIGIVFFFILNLFSSHKLFSCERINFLVNNNLCDRNIFIVTGKVVCDRNNFLVTGIHFKKNRLKKKIVGEFH